MDKVKRRLTWGIAASLLFLFIFQASTAVKDKSIIYDEMAHIPAGYSYLVTGDYRINFFHPPFTKYLSGLPLVFMHLPRPQSISSWNTTDEYRFGRDFMKASGDKQDKVVFSSRFMMILLGASLGLLVFYWAKLLWGNAAGLFALFLYVFEPNILAHSALVTPDIGLSFSVILSSFLFWKLTSTPSFKNKVLFGASLGIAFLSKLSALILMPVFAVLFFIRNPGQKGKLSAFIFVIVVALLTVWFGYGFETGKILAPKDNYPGLNALTGHYPDWVKKPIEYIAKDLTVPNPSFFRGLGWLYYTGAQKHESFFWGSHFRGPSLPGFLAAFLIKTPIPLLLLLVLCLFILIRRKRLLEWDNIILISIPVFFFLVNSVAAVSLQLKYVLPVYPFICIFISQIVGLLSGLRPRLVIIIISAWYIVSSVGIYPHYLAYFNEFVGGPKNGYKYLVDSNLDWGQDLKLLKRYMDKEGIESVSLAYFGTQDPAYYGIRYANLDPCRPVKGWVAVSATYLEGVHILRNGFDWLKGYKPVTAIGYTIFMYHIK